MNCEEVREKIFEFLRGDLDPGETLDLEDHLSGCEACRALLELERTTERVLREMPQHEAPAGLRAEIRKRVYGHRKRRLPYLLPRLAPALAALVLLLVWVFHFGRGPTELEATALFVEVMSPQEGEALLADDATFLMTIFPSMEVEVEITLDGDDITHQAKIGKGYVMMTLSPLEEGYHTLTARVEEPASREEREISRMFYAVTER
jgi:anti-sigma factor (TIGR02949 family)